MSIESQLSAPLAEIPAGKYLGERRVEVTPDLIRRFSEGSADFNPSYTGDSPFGGPVAPALIGSHEPWRFNGWYAPEVRGTLHSKQEWDLFAPIPVGSTYVARAVVAERHLKRERHVIVNEVTLSDEAGRPCARGRTHQSFWRTQPEGLVVDRAREQSSERRFTPGLEPIRERIEGDWLTLTPELCLAATDGKRNYHSDAEIARQMGFPEVVVQGVFNANIVSALMTRRFGAGWWSGGQMRMSFVNVIWGGDDLRACVAVRELVDEEPNRRALCEAWVEKREGTVTAIGTVSAVVPS